MKMPTTGGSYCRREKESDADTVLYEIDMLRFARDRLLSPQPWWEERDEWLYLEDFLLHYRNLIEFFGKKGPRESDLSILRPDCIWPGRVPDKAILDSLTKPDLWEKYDTRDNDKAISEYLHHCTTQRTETMHWNVRIMYEELLPLIENFESLLPEYKLATVLTRGRVVGGPTLDAISTASTRTLDLGLNPDK
jgi:hypothetical protein